MGKHLNGRRAATRVLVTYATKNGSTAGIAEAVAGQMRHSGIQVDVQAAGQVRDLRPYGAVILGSALYIGHWQKEAIKFGRRHAQELAQRPVWLFASGPLDRSTEEKEIPPVDDAADLAAQIHPRGHVTFGGRVTEETKGFIARSMVKQGRGGDFRNFDRIRIWADSVAAEILGIQSPDARERPAGRMVEATHP